MKRKEYLLFISVVAIAFWQIFFLKYGMKWDFVDAFLPSRYFFTESVLNNQFPLWNPYLLYGTPIYADLVSVFNPEFWIVGNMFGYSNITLQFVFLAYVFIAGVSFFHFLKLYNSDHHMSIGLSVAYMLSGFVIGNSQHVAFVCGYALIPFLLTAYIKFIRDLNRQNFVRAAIALFLMVYCSYPAITIISAYFLLCIFIWHLIDKWPDKSNIKKSILYHLALSVVVVLFSATLLLAYYQLSPFLVRFSGLPLELALKHPFSVQSVLSFLTPMAAGNDPKYFLTDQSISNGYWGIISLVFFLFTLTKKTVHKESYLILFFGIFSLFASFGDGFVVREFLYDHAPLMDRFQYPGLFRAFTIFSFLAFTGININHLDFDPPDRKRLIIISGSVVVLLIFLIGQSIHTIDAFAYFKNDVSFTDELFQATRFDNIILQGTVQIALLSIFILFTLKIKGIKNYSTALLLLFIADGIVSSQLNAHYTVLSKTDPIAFSAYLKSSPKGFPVPGLTPIGENTDSKAANDFTWMNNNVFPKKATFDGLVSFKMDGYKTLSDNHPGLLEAIKREPVVYFSDDIKENSSIRDFKSTTAFLEPADYKELTGIDLGQAPSDSLMIISFSPTKIEIKTYTSFQQLLIYQQNYYKGWKVYIDGVENHLLKTNFTHMSVIVPPGQHTVRFQYSNKAIIYAFCFTSIVFFILIAFSIKYYVAGHPDKKRRVIYVMVTLLSIFIMTSGINRYLYKKNKIGLAPVIAQKVDNWKSMYKNDIRILLSTQDEELMELPAADAVCFINEKNNVAGLSDFLADSKSRYFAFGWQGGIIGGDLLELVNSYYPTTIELEKRDNSGIMLLEKSDKEKPYQIIRDFEPNGPGNWNEDPARIKMDTLTGNHSYFYTENDEFGTSVEFQAGDDLIKKEKITIFTDFVIEDNLSEVLLVFTTQRADELKIYRATDISIFAKSPEKWYRAVDEIQIKPEIQKGDIVKIYFWNKNKANFQFDNLKIKWD
jgi:hypothetical protein